MRKPKTDKLLKGIVGTSVALFGITGCSSNSQEELFFVSEETTTEATAAQITPPSPDEADCDTWTWDEEGEVYQCVQEDSENYGHYYSGGSWFPTIAAFMAGQAIGRSGTKNAKVNDNRRQDSTSTSTSNQKMNQNKQNSQTTTGQQTNRMNTNSGQLTNSRSGMGSGGTFGG